jgi:hypothetical protein
MDVEGGGASMIRVKALSAGIAALVVLVLPGCYTEPAYVAVPVSAPANFDTSWQAARGAAYDEGVQVTSEDRSSGTLRGTKGGSNVLISVAQQANGSVRVVFNVTGPPSENPDLQNRLTRSYNRRMGR